MNRAPSFQFYPGDWRRDTQVQMSSMATRGVWHEMLCCMWDAPERGKLTGTLTSMSRLIGCSVEELVRAIEEIEALKIGDVTLCNDWKHNCNAEVTVINRRMVREERERQQGKTRVQRYRERKGNARGNADVTPPSSFSSSSSSSKKNTYSPDFEAFYAAYPIHQAKPKAFAAWKKINLQNGTFEAILQAIVSQKAHKNHLKKTGQFCQEWPHPATWLNGRRWEDEIPLQAAIETDDPIERAKRNMGL